MERSLRCGYSAPCMKQSIQTTNRSECAVATKPHWSVTVAVAGSAPVRFTVPIRNIPVSFSAGRSSIDRARAPMDFARGELVWTNHDAALRSHEKALPTTREPASAAHSRPEPPNDPSARREAVSRRVSRAVVDRAAVAAGGARLGAQTRKQRPMKRAREACA